MANSKSNQGSSIAQSARMPSGGDEDLPTIDSGSKGKYSDLSFIVTPNKLNKAVAEQNLKPVLVRGVCDESDAVRVYCLHHQVKSTSRLSFSSVKMTEETIKLRRERIEAQKQRKREQADPYSLALA